MQLHTCFTVRPSVAGVTRARVATYIISTTTKYTWTDITFVDIYGIEYEYLLFSFESVYFYWHYWLHSDGDYNKNVHNGLFPFEIRLR